MSARPKTPSKPPRTKRGTAKGHESGAIPIPKNIAAGAPDDDQKTGIYDSGERRTNVEHSGSIQVISMKTPGVGSGPAPVERPRPQVKLRAISEITPVDRAVPDLGRLAPPRDPRDVRARRVRDYIVWASIAVIIASAIALGIWFLAR